MTVVMNSPKLDHCSVFRLYVSLTDIPYWRDKKCLRSEGRSQNGDLLKFQFLVWEQDCAVHGETTPKPESTEGRPWGQPLKKAEGAPVNLG